MFGHTYSRLPNEKDEGLEGAAQRSSEETHRVLREEREGISSSFPTTSRCLIAFNCIVAGMNLLILFYLSRFYTPTDSLCAKQLSSFSPAIDTVRGYHEVTFNGTLTAPSQWRGPPTPEIDEAWNNITKGRFIPISMAELEMLGKSNISVKYPLDRGGEYVGMLEVFHQLHCLNMLRKASYSDYYTTMGTNITDLPDMDHTHLDHCVEMLRQNLMCTSDVGVLTFNWVKGQEHPTPDFNTKHKCRDFDDVWMWNQEHAKRFGERWRYGGEIELDHLP